MSTAVQEQHIPLKIEYAIIIQCKITFNIHDYLGYTHTEKLQLFSVYLLHCIYVQPLLREFIIMIIIP